MSSVVAVSVDWAFLSASRGSIRTFVSQRAVGFARPPRVLEPQILIDQDRHLVSDRRTAAQGAAFPTGGFAGVGWPVRNRTGGWTVTSLHGILSLSVVFPLPQKSHSMLFGFLFAASVCRTVEALRRRAIPLPPRMPCLS